MDKMRVAVNTEITSKTENWKSLTHNYKILDLTYEELESYLENGNVIAQAFDNAGKFHRKETYFKSADWFGLDFDEGADDLFKELKKTWDHKVSKSTLFIRENACLFYTTANHNKEKNGITASRFRVIFHLPERVTDPEEFKKIVIAFLNKYPKADKKCKDPARFFYGAGKDGGILILGKRLTRETLSKILADNGQKINSKPKPDVIQDNETVKKDLIDNRPKIKPVESSKKEISNKLLPESERPLDTLISNTINKNLEILKNASIGNRDAVLNKVCYHLGQMLAGLKWDDQFRAKLKQDLKDTVKKIALDLGSLDNFESFTEKKIIATIDRSIDQGEQKPNDYTREKTLQTEIWFLNYHGYETKNTILTPEAKRKALADLKKKKDIYTFKQKDGTSKIIESDTRNNILKKHINRKPKAKTRLFPNQKKQDHFQITQSILTNYPTSEIIDNITDQDLNEAEERQIAHFGSFAISTTENINRESMNRVFLTLQDSETIRHYLALWKYANVNNILDLNDIDLNEIIKQMNPETITDKKAMYRNRKKFIKYITLLSTVTLFKSKKTSEPGIYDIAGTHLIGDFKIKNKNRHTYLTCKLPEHLGSFGVYIPDKIFLLTGNDKGSFNLAFALLKESFRINGYENLKLNNKNVSNNNKSIKWGNDRLLKEIKTINTSNETKKNLLIKNILIKLEDIGIIDNYFEEDEKKTIFLR